jgi:hypothetical protein
VGQLLGRENKNRGRTACCKVAEAGVFDSSFLSCFDAFFLPSILIHFSAIYFASEANLTVRARRWRVVRVAWNLIDSNRQLPLITT